MICHPDRSEPGSLARGLCVLGWEAERGTCSSLSLPSKQRNELKSVETEIKYAGYLDQQKKSIEKLKKAEQRNHPRLVRLQSRKRTLPRNAGETHPRTPIHNRPGQPHPRSHPRSLNARQCLHRNPGWQPQSATQPRRLRPRHRNRAIFSCHHPSRVHTSAPVAPGQNRSHAIVPN